MSESTEQVSVVKWFRAQYPKTRIISIPNGAQIAGSGKRKFGLINKYKAEGMTNGVSDLFICKPNELYAGLWLEMNDIRKTACSLSKDQKEFMQDMLAAGYHATWAAGFDQAREEIEKYMNT